MIGSTFLVVRAPLSSPSFHLVAHGSSGRSRHWCTRRSPYRSCTSVIAQSRARVKRVAGSTVLPALTDAERLESPLTECLPEKKLAWSINTSPAVCDALTLSLTSVPLELQESGISSPSKGVWRRGPVPNEVRYVLTRCGIVST